MTRDQSQKILRCSIGLVSQRVRPRSDHISQRTGSRVRSRGRPLTAHGPTRSTINRWLRSPRTPQSSCLVLTQTIEIVDKSSYRAPRHKMRDIVLRREGLLLEIGRVRRPTPCNFLEGFPCIHSSQFGSSRKAERCRTTTCFFRLLSTEGLVLGCNRSDGAGNRWPQCDRLL